MVNRKTVEQIKIDVARDVEAGLYDQETGDAVVAFAIERAGETPEPPAILAPDIVIAGGPRDPAPGPIPELIEEQPDDDFALVPTEAEIVARVAQQRRAKRPSTRRQVSPSGVGGL